MKSFTPHVLVQHYVLHSHSSIHSFTPTDTKKQSRQRWVTYPASCESTVQTSEHQSHMLGSPWGSPSSVGKQMEQTDKRAAQSARKQQTGEEGTDLCFHGNKLLSGVKVPLLHFFLKSLRWKTQIRKNEFHSNSLVGIRKTSCLSGPFSLSQQKNNAVPLTSQMSCDACTTINYF